MKKAVFFDIDGTIWDEKFYIPDSAIEGIRQLRENGNYAFICSGRSRAMVTSQKLFDVGFDGIVAGCGTHVEFQNQVIAEEIMPYELVEKNLKLWKEHQWSGILEGPDSVYYERNRFQEDPYLKLLEKELGSNLKPLEEIDETAKISKGCLMYQGVEKEKLDLLLSDDFELMYHTDFLLEFAPKGFSKAVGIQKACEHLGIRHEDTYAFGDSVNDIEMLQYVGHGIAMGNAVNEAKEAADYVTSPLHENGIWDGLKHFSLL